MGQIKVRNLDDWVINTHRLLAEQAGNSLEQHLREMLEESALRCQAQFAEEQALEREKFVLKYGVVADSTEGIRQDRITSS